MSDKTKDTYEEKRLEWLEGINVGDRVCVSNVFNSKVANIFAKMFGGESVNKVCIISTLRAKLPDGCFVVDNDIFDEQGRLVTTSYDSRAIPALYEPTKEYETAAWRIKFVSSIKQIDWDAIDDDGITAIITAINDSVDRKRVRDEEAQKILNEKRKESNENKQYQIVNARNSQVSMIDDQQNIMRQMVEHKEVGADRDNIIKSIIEELEKKYKLEKREEQ